MTTYNVAADFNGDGDFVDAGDDLTARVLDGRSPLVMQYGRDQSRALSPVGPGEAHFALNNISRDYSPENASSPLYGLVLPGRGLRVTAANGPIVFDPFSRTASNGWGPAEAGGQWAVSSTSTASVFSVSSNAGRVSLASVSSGQSIVMPLSVADVNQVATFSTPVTASGGSINGYLLAHRIDDDNRYLGRICFDTDGLLKVAVEKTVAGSGGTVVGLTSTGISYATNTGYRLRFEIVGTTLRARAWPASGTEPTTWLVSGTDTDLQTAATIGVRGLLASGNTNTLPVAVSVDDLTVLSGDPQTLIRAQLDDMTFNPDYNDRYLNVDAVDVLGALRGNIVSTGLYRGLRTGEAMGILLDAAGIPLTSRVLDVGATVMPYWWLDNNDAYDALMELLASEGPPSLITVDTSSRIVFMDRHHRLRNPQSITSQATWRSSGTEPLISSPADYNHGFKEIINSISFEMPVRSSTGALTQVWSQQGLISIPSGATVTITAQASDPFYNAVAPVQDTDYTLLSGITPAVTLSRTSGLSTTIAIQAGTACVIQDLSLRAASLPVTSTVQVTAEDGSSIIKYKGRRTLPDARTPTWASIPDARGICSVMLGMRADRLPTIRVTMKSANTQRLAQQLTRDLSDRVHVVEEHTGLDSDCYVEQIAHSIAQGGLDHQTTFGVEKAPSQLPDVFILGSATNGVLGTNKLGRRGISDPGNVFILGSSTNGVLGSNILAA